MNPHEMPKPDGTRYTAECIFCYRRFDIPVTQGPVVPFHLNFRLNPNGIRCPGAYDRGRIVKTTL